MPHTRRRYLLNNILSGLTFSPIIGILGHRQVGKTTLLESICKTYHSLDDIDTLDAIEKSPKTFLKNVTHVNNIKIALDECQKSSKLFPALKEFVRTNKSPGRFMLSGSVRFTSKKSIQESLTGRIVTYELLPMTVSEILQRPVPKIISSIMNAKNVEHIVASIHFTANEKNKINDNIDHYTKNGGLPGVLFIRDEKIRRNKILDQIQTIIDRDLRSIHDTSLSYHVLINFFKFLAANQGKKFNASLAKQKTGIGFTTQKHLLFALEAIFLIRPMSVTGGPKDAVQLTYYLEDQAESFLMSEEQSSLEFFEQLIYRNTRAELFYNIQTPYRITSFQTRGGARIPFVYNSNESTIGILPILDDSLNASQKASITSFYRNFANAKVLVVTRDGREIRVIDERTLMLPAYAVV